MKKFVGSLYDYEYIGNVTSEHSSDKKEVVIITELSKLVSYTDISEEEDETVGQKGEITMNSTQVLMRLSKF